MAILSKIREQSIFLIFIIALGLFAFLIDPTKIIDFFANGGSKEFVAKINDEVIQRESFARKVEAGQRGGQQTSMQVANNVYNQEVTRILVQGELDKLGITVEKDQMWDLFKTNYSSLAQFKNEDGNFDEGKLKEFIESQVEANAKGWENQEESIAFSGKQQLYYALIKAGSLPTEKEGELAYKMQNVALRYVYFQEKPSKEDEDVAKQEIKNLLTELKSVSNIETFVNENSATEYDSIYNLKTALDTNIQKEIDSMSIGETFGPYTFGEYTKIAKLTASKIAPSVKASHALISYKGAERANPEVTRTKEEAKTLANNLLAKAKTNNTDFAAFATENSDGPSASKGGDLGWFYEGQMVAAFNDFVFSNKKETIGLVETDFGFHIIKVVDTKKEKKYQLAIISKKLEASQKTIDELYAEASQFEVDANAGKFEDIATEKKYVLRPVNKITELSENLPGLDGNQRNIVQWMYNNDTNIGDIKRFDINGSYAVVQLTSKKEKGLMSTDDASFKVLPILRNQEKAKLLRDKVTASTLSDIAANQKTTVKNANAISMSNPTLPGAGREAKVVGTAFALEKGEFSKLIDGTNGVYKIEVLKHTNAPKMDSYKSFAKDPANNINAVGTKVMEALKEKAVIEDNRASFY